MRAYFGQISRVFRTKYNIRKIKFFSNFFGNFTNVLRISKNIWVRRTSGSFFGVFNINEKKVVNFALVRQYFNGDDYNLTTYNAWSYIYIYIYIFLYLFVRSLTPLCFMFVYCGWVILWTVHLRVLTPLRFIPEHRYHNYKLILNVNTIFCFI